MCELCQTSRRAAERALWASAKAEGKPYGGSNVEARRKTARAKTKRRYDARMAAGLCARCGKHPVIEGSVSCAVCKAARHARERAQWRVRRAVASRRGPLRSLRRAVVNRSAEHRGIPVWPARYTVIELATGIDQGTFDSDAEVAACLAFAKLGPDDVEIVSNASPMERFTGWA